MTNLDSIFKSRDITVANLETEQPWGPWLDCLRDEELRRMCQQMIPTGPEVSVPPGSNHSLESLAAPAQLLQASCTRGGGSLLAGRSLKSPGILQASWCWGAYFPSPSLESPTCRWPRHDWFGGLPGICLGWRSEERWGRNIETSLQVSVLAHSRPIYNPRKRLPLSFLPSKPEWDIRKCCCLMAVYVTTAVKLVFRGASNSQGPLVWKWLLPPRNNLGVGNLIWIWNQASFPVISFSRYIVYTFFKIQKNTYTKSLISHVIREMEMKFTAYHPHTSQWPSSNGQQTVNEIQKRESSPNSRE